MARNSLVAVSKPIPSSLRRQNLSGYCSEVEREREREREREKFIDKQIDDRRSK
jgi:hypothetical protein